MGELIERLKEGVLLADGAMGTMLIKYGLAPGDCPEKINLERPELLKRIAGEYLNAGAEIIQTNTFGASPLKLKLYNLDDKTEEINKIAVEAARNAIQGKAFISGSCGPSGRLLEPYGDVTHEIMFASFKRQAMALISAGVDLICVETMTDLNEAKLAISAIKSIDSDVPVCGLMTFDLTPRGFFTVMGTTIERAAAGLEEAGADIVGSNCGNGIEMMIEITREFKKHSRLPIMIKPNAGLPRLEGDVAVYPDTPAFMADKSEALLEFGINIIGGCCGTTPEHIAAMKKRIDNFNKYHR